MGYWKLVRKELKKNKDYKIKLVLLMFRTGGYFYEKNFIFTIIFFVTKFFYKLCVEYILTIELPLNTKVGFGLKIEHGHGLVVNSSSILGENVTLKHSVTIGCKTDLDNHCVKHAIIGNNVVVNPLSCIIGVTVKDNVIIGAGSIVVKNVATNSIVAGNPAKLIKTIK